MLTDRKAVCKFTRTSLVFTKVLCCMFQKSYKILLFDSMWNLSIKVFIALGVLG